MAVRILTVITALCAALGLGLIWSGCSGGGHGGGGAFVGTPPPPPPGPPAPPPPPPPPPPVKPTGAVPVGLPSTFVFGVANNDPTTISGIGIKARYQYLTGGVNTGVGWETYNTPTGAFAGLFMSSSQGLGLVPVFTYQEMIVSNPHSGGTESAKILSNLQNATTMNAYFANWKLLMTQCASFGGKVIIHLEPDLWGYVEQSVDGGTNSAASVPAAVASSGYVDAAGLPDTVQGYALALLKMRDLYAPNALLALSLSYWGTNANWSSGTTLDLQTLSGRQSAFFKTCGIANNPMGIKPMDLFFSETHDRDSGFYKSIGQPGNTWTDTDMARYRDYIALMNAATGLRFIIWQVPCGNTVFRTCNDTDGHYQNPDSVYFLENFPSNKHIQEFANAGVIGVLFGATTTQTTNYNDAKGDGITNPAPAAGNTGTTSTVADDDGGYLRLRITAYQQTGGLSLP